ncbi:MAG: ACT domain-containing protein [Candidatus Eremiobacteraeota bacterium]|nr:ACT domain-containing protein [Candidatus Eremiobacteraeota bacterium]
MRVSYQGEPGAFSEDAARLLVAGCEPVACATFDDTFAAAASGRTDAALLPVENSISGAVPRVYDLLWNDPALTVHDEIVYRVVQNLIALPGAALEALEEVRSHPVALEQCRNFLTAHPRLRATAVADTAGAVREIVRLGDRALGAIASAAAAETYGATILQPGIQDVAANFTRFFLLRPGRAAASRAGRACIALVLEHKPGALRRALGAFAERNVNLRSIVSRPSLDEPFTYRFYLEIEGAPEQLAAALGIVTGTIRVLGAY